MENKFSLHSLPEKCESILRLNFGSFGFCDVVLFRENHAVLFVDFSRGASDALLTLKVRDQVLGQLLYLNSWNLLEWLYVDAQGLLDREDEMGIKLVHLLSCDMPAWFDPTPFFGLIIWDEEKAREEVQAVIFGAEFETAAGIAMTLELYSPQHTALELNSES